MSLLSGRTINLKHKALGLVAVPLTFQIIFFVSLLCMMHTTEQIVKTEENARKQLFCFNSLNFCMNGALKALMGLAMMGGDEFVELYHQAVMPLDGEFDQLKTLLAHDPKRREMVEKLHGQARSLLGHLDEVLEIAKTGDNVRAMVATQQLKPELLSFMTEIKRMRDDNERVMRSSFDKQKAERERFRTLLIAGIGFNIVLGVMLALSFNKTTTRRLSVLMDNSRRLAAGKPLNPPIDGTDEIAHLDSVFNEMAATLTEAQEKERAVVNYAQEVICSLDSEGRFTKVNPAAIKVWGYEPQELITKVMTTLVHEEDQEPTKAALKRLMTENPNGSFENRIIGASGTVIDTLWSVHWSAQDSSLFCVAHNITDRKEMERLKQEFQLMVSHDLRTPLTSVYSVLKLVLAKALGPISQTVEDKLGIAVRNLERLITLINDMMDLEKLEAGGMSFEMKDEPVAPILQHSVQTLEGFAHQHDVNLEYIDSDAHVWADSGRIIQVLVNLISNAIKFSPKKQTVTVSVVESDEMIEFRVQDRGRGIPPQHQKAIFERFTQVEAADGKRNVGTGIGLTVCKLIVTSHEGVIGVDSEPGKGSTFWFRIPKKTVGAADHIITISEEPAQTKVTSQ